MAFSLNKIMLIGNLGNAAETRFTTTNKSVTSFSLATTNSYKGKDGNWMNETTWHNCQSWDLPDFYKEALKKGAKVYVEGRIKKSEYTDKEGVKRYSVDVITEKIIPLEKTEHTQQSTEQQTQTGQYESTPEPDAVTTGQDDSDSLPF